MNKIVFIKKINKYIIFILCTFVILTNTFTISFAESNSAYGRVLFISSYSYAWDTVQIQIDGIKENIGDNITLDYEYMDTKRINNDDWIKMFYETLKYKMSITDPYDVIIVGDDAALTFALEYREDLFKDTPILFEGVNNKDLAKKATECLNITGVAENLSFKKNIDLALTFFPNAKNVTAILDNTITGEAERQSFYKNASQYPNLTFSEINTSILTTEKLKTEISNISEDTILIYIVMTEDQSGKKYTNTESIKLISKYAKVPAFRMVSGGIGEGLLGGNIVSMELSGKIVADMATQIINGKSPTDFNLIIDSPNIYFLDENIMEKFNIDLSLIPEGATVINHKLSAIEKHKNILFPSILIIIFLTLIVIITLRDNKRKKQLMLKLDKSKQYLLYLNLHDSLTGIGNRNKLREDYKDLISKEISCSIMMIDIDNFKNINDSYGHIIGDKILSEFSKRLEKISSEILTPYRLSGDEFTILFQSTDKKHIEKQVKRLLKAISIPFKINNEFYSLSVSIGIAICTKEDTIETAIEKADKAMYYIKKNGKNSYTFY